MSLTQENEKKMFIRCFESLSNKSRFVTPWTATADNNSDFVLVLPEVYSRILQSSPGYLAAPPVLKKKN